MHCTCQRTYGDPLLEKETLKKAATIQLHIHDEVNVCEETDSMLGIVAVQDSEVMSSTLCPTSVSARQLLCQNTECVSAVEIFLSV
jgi:hypothetical protein